MKVGLIDVDSKIPNLALMKISAYHKQKGDKVKWFDPLFDNPDRVYASKVFTYSNDYAYYPGCDLRKGGSGFGEWKKWGDSFTCLKDEIEYIMPDYELYQDVNYSLGFTSRGCIRNCPFCIVPKKEGKLTPHTDIYSFWNKEHKNIVMLDNNILALPTHFEKVAKQIIDNNLKADFNQGLDIRLLTDDVAKILKQMKPLKQWRFAFDSLKQEAQFRRGAEILLKNKISKSRICIYVLTGFKETFDDTLKRINIIYNEYGFDPFVMLYQDFSTKKTEHREIRKLKKWGRDFKDYKNMARWVNHKAIFKSVKWEDYK